MATISSACLASLLSSCRLLQVIITLKLIRMTTEMVKTDFLVWDFQKLALENCSLDAPSVNAIAQNSGLQVSEPNFCCQNKTLTKNRSKKRNEIEKTKTQVLHLGGTSGLTGPLVTNLLASCPSIQVSTMCRKQFNQHVQKAIQSTCAESISKNSQLKWKLNFAGAEHRLDKSSCSWRGSCCHRYLSAFSILERALLLPFSCVHWLSFPNVNPIFVIFLIFANISQVWIPILRGSAFPATETLFSIPTSVP